MKKTKLIMYWILCVAYLFFGFLCYPRFNSDVAFVALIIIAVGAWAFGSHFGLMASAIILPYHYFLFDYHADDLVFYQGKAIGTLSVVIISYIAGSLKELRDQVKQQSILLDNRVAERTAQLNGLIIELITNDERIRRNLGQDIHDGLGQNLTGLLLYSSSLYKELKNNNSTHLARMDDIICDAKNTLEMARKISRTLFPVKMTETGLESAIDELTSYFAETNSVEFTVDLDGSEQFLPEDVIVHFYRIAYEGILNTLHQDKPTHIGIQFRSRDSSHQLRIQIVGCLNPNGVFSSMFVELIKYRARLIEAELKTTVLNDGSIVISCLIPERHPIAAPPLAMASHG